MPIVAVNDIEKPTSVGRACVRWGLYPFLWLIKLGTFYMLWYSNAAPENLAAASSAFVLVLCFGLELCYPYDKRWAMTWRSFWSDIKFAVPNALTLYMVGILLAYFAISASANLSGPASDWPFAAQLAACLLVFEGLNYGVHRAMHELPGSFGGWLWKVHAAHHLPPRLYLVMHAVFHPINAIITRALVIVMPVWVMGYDQQVVAIFAMIMSLHGIISHFNVDMRMGWANYLFVGPELHRYHHSARPDECRNYGAVLSIFDQLFGTFVYRPGVPPQNLGVMPDCGLPDYDRTSAVLALPFR
jgi:sterol desaturase/sphingolipid hydroxylase (fatty acid hydroxylase superfamily)